MKNTDPNARLALNNLKQEIANELGIQNNFGNTNGDMGKAGRNVFDGGKIGGNMTKRMVSMAEKQLKKK